MPVRRVVAAAAAACLLAGCGSGASSTRPSGKGSSPGSGVSAPHVIESSPATSDPSPAAGASGSPDHPVVVRPRPDLLDWRRVPGSTEDLVTVGDRWTLTVAADRRSARLSGPHPRTIRAGAHASITDTFLDRTHALVVSEDRLAQDPDVATLVDLASGRATTLDRTSSPPPAVGGTWALGPKTLVHATSGPHRSYCLATVELAGGSGTTGWCAQPRHGFSRAAINGDTTTVMTFDAHHPSCRTVGQVSGDEVSPLPGVTPCKGWDSAVTGSGAVWSVVPQDRRIEAAHFYAHTSAGGWYDLGPGTSGSLVTCGGSSYFTRDPGSRTGPATLLRWSPETAELSVVYESVGTGNAFLAPPRCGGSQLTVTSYSQAGDEQATTSVG